MPEERYITLIAKRLAGETSKSEEEKLNKWLEQPANMEVYSFYQAMWHDTRMNYRSGQSAKTFQHISSHINDGRRFFFPDVKPVEKKRPLGVFPLLAAIFALIIISLATIYYFVDVRGALQDTEITMLERELPKGQKMKIFLPDGSIVWLNAASTLRYPERFNGNQRNVYLEGEAFFEIEEDPEKPFIVQTSLLEVTALGTSFNVRNYDFEEEVQVALNTGKVLVRKGGKNKEQLMLVPGQGAFYNKTAEVIEKQRIDPEKVFLWKDGIICFKDASFSEVIDRLSRWYGVEFEIQNYEGQQWSYTGNFEENEYLSNVLKSISFTKGFEYEIDQNKVCIKF